MGKSRSGTWRVGDGEIMRKRQQAARMTIMPNGEPRGRDTAAEIIETARAKAKEGKDAEAIKWAALCNFSDRSEQDAIRRDSAAVLEYLKK